MEASFCIGASFYMGGLVLYESIFSVIFLLFSLSSSVIVVISYTIYLYIFMYAHIFISNFHACLSAYLYQLTCLTIYSNVCPLVFMSVYKQVCLYMYSMQVSMSVWRMHVCRYVCLSINLFAYHSVLGICLPLMDRYTVAVAASVFINTVLSLERFY